MRRYLVMRCSCGKENIFPMWVDSEEDFTISLSGNGIKLTCGNPDCNAEMEVLIRSLAQEELDNLKATMSLTGSQQDMEALTF